MDAKSIKPKVADTGDSEVEQGGQDRLRTLGEMTAALPLEDNFLGDRYPAVGDLPSAADMAAAILRQGRELELRCSAVRETLAAMTYEFDWQLDDLSVERDVGLTALAELERLAKEQAEAVFRWLRAINRGWVIELREGLRGTVAELARSIPRYRGFPLELVVCAAVEHLAGSSDAAQIIAESEQRRLSDLELPRDRTGNTWPWTTLTGGPWDNGRHDAPAAGTSAARRATAQKDSPPAKRTRTTGHDPNSSDNGRVTRPATGSKPARANSTAKLAAAS